MSYLAIARETLARLRKEKALASPTVDSLPEEWREFWAERAAIMEYDGGMDREKAEAEALEDVLRILWQRGYRS